MRTIGLFKSGTMLGSEMARDSGFAYKRAIAIGVHKQSGMDSSQRTSLLIQPFMNRRTQYAIQNKNDVKHALTRVRNAGSVTPKKCNSKR